MYKIINNSQMCYILCPDSYRECLPQDSTVEKFVVDFEARENFTINNNDTSNNYKIKYCIVFIILQVFCMQYVMYFPLQPGSLATRVAS